MKITKIGDDETPPLPPRDTGASRIVPSSRRTATFSARCLGDAFPRQRLIGIIGGLSAIPGCNLAAEPRSRIGDKGNATDVECELRSSRDSTLRWDRRRVTMVPPPVPSANFSETVKGSDIRELYLREHSLGVGYYLRIFPRVSVKCYKIPGCSLES